MWSFLIIVVGGLIAQNLASRIHKIERQLAQWRVTLNQMYAERGIVMPDAVGAAAPAPSPVDLGLQPQTPPVPVVEVADSAPISPADVGASLPSEEPEAEPAPAAVETPKIVAQAAPPAPVLSAPQPVEEEVAPVATPAAAHKPEPETAPEPQPEPAPAVQPATAPKAKRTMRIQPPKISFEELFGAKLPIWVGGISLAIAGLYLVIYVVEQIRFTPLLRECLGMAFAVTLVALAEVARNWKTTAIDQRVAQALAGAGIAVAYTVFLTATNYYHLMTPGAGFVGLALVTLSALGLALRYGAPCGVLGLVGGFAAPALVGQAPGDVKLLAAYLLLTICGIAGLARKQGWGWLANLALLGGFGWGAVMLTMNLADQAASAALGGYTLMLGLIVPLLAGANDKAGLSRSLPAGLAAIEMAAFVARGGFTPFVWGFYGLIAVGIIILARIDVRLKALPRLAMIVGLVTVAIWPAPAMVQFYTVIGAGMLIFAGSALQNVWSKRGSAVDAGQAAVAVLGGLAVAYIRTPQHNDHQFAVACFGFAALFALMSLLGWRNAARRDDARFATLASTAITLVATGIVLAVPHANLPPLLMALALGTLLLGRRAEDKRLEEFARGGAMVAVVSLAATWGMTQELLRAYGLVPPYDVFAGLWRYGLTAVLLGVFSMVERDRTLRQLTQAGAALLLTVAFAQLVPAFYLPILGALGVLVLAELGARFKLDGRAAMASFTLVTLAWMLPPFIIWLSGVLKTLGGVPLLASALPLPDVALSRIMIPTMLIGLAAWRSAQTFARKLIAWGAGVAVMIALFVFYKHAFGLHSEVDFYDRGMLERILLTQLLFAGGALAWMQRARAPQLLMRLALLFTGLGLFRTLWFEGVVFNPIWHDQWLGNAPLVNLLAPALLAPMFWAYLYVQQHSPRADKLRLPQTLMQIALILLFAYANIRMAFHGGTALAFGDITPGEDITRSVVAIGLAVGFLRWGISRGLRIWRIASLILMLCAVGKVFLFDAAGLTGLFRIFSFMALGVSLIGIGWLYSRHLKTD